MIDATSTTAPNAWRRQLYLMLDAYRAQRALYDAMVHLSQADR